jgi:hypothetical protein
MLLLSGVQPTVGVLWKVYVSQLCVVHLISNSAVLEDET